MLDGAVTSADGTTIGYRRFGDGGPGVVLVHGALQASQNFTQLADALADAFTVYVPDRRGRGRSGPHGAAYGLARECEDLGALLAHTGAPYLFGLSSGAIIALATALHAPGVTRLALFEPPLSIDHSTPTAWGARAAREIAAGSLASAMITAIRGTQVSRVFGRVPRWVLAPLLHVAIAAEARRPIADHVPLRTLIPTVPFDCALVIETEGTLARYRDLAVPTLLLGGERSPAFLGATLAALQATLPDARRVELIGTDHLAADNTGVPLRVAAELRRFFA